MTTDPTTAATSPDAAEMVLREEQLHVRTVRGPVERVIVRRRVVTQVRQIEVTVLREELEVRRLLVDGDPTQQFAANERPPDVQSPASSQSLPAATRRAVASRPPLVIVLSEQVPVVQLHTRPSERVTVTVETVTEQQELREQVSHETAEVTVDDQTTSR